MTRAILWKEFREQGLIGLSLISLGSAVLIAAAVLAEPPVATAGASEIIRSLGAGLLATLLLAVTAGMVCGGALFAGEKESGTLHFLESLPSSRWDLWRAKLIAGSLLVAIQVGLVIAVAAGLGLIPSTGWAFAIAVYSLLAFAWGTYGSSRSRTTLGSVGIAIPSASLAAILFLVPISIIFHAPPGGIPVRMEGGLIFLLLMVLTPLINSSRTFTLPDRQRRESAFDLPRETVRSSGDRRTLSATVAPSPGWRFLIRATLWLTYRQMVKPGCLLIGFAVAFGLSLLLPPLSPILIWPILALAAGVLSGVTILVDEQSQGIARFWGERRLPIFRVWAIKLLVHAGFAVFLALLLVLPLLLTALAKTDPVERNVNLASVFRSSLLTNLGNQSWKFLFAPLAYGFAAGHLCGLLFRKAVVATGVASLLGGTAFAMWFPSLVAGGLLHWQIWIPPILTILFAGTLLRPWTAERLAMRGPLTALAGGLLVVFLFEAAGIGYRAIEIGHDSSAEDDIKYLAGLIPIDANIAGREFRGAAEQFAKLTPTRLHAEELAIRLRNNTQPDANREEVAAWLEKVYGSEKELAPGSLELTWHQSAALAAKKETGLFEHPMLSSYPTFVQALENGKRMANAILAHGLQRQANADPKGFLDDFRTTLALSRNMRNGSLAASLQDGNIVSLMAFTSADRWLEQIRDRPDLVREALDAVLLDDRFVPTQILPDGQVLAASFEQAPPRYEFDPRPHILSERCMIREQMKSPNQWLPDLMTPMGGDKQTTSPICDLVEFSWSVPWEQERTWRLVGISTDANEHTRLLHSIRGRPGAFLMLPRFPSGRDLPELDRQLRAVRRAAILKLAIRLYVEEKHAIPENLDSLVSARILSYLPVDPYDGGAFRYRIVAEGETFRQMKKSEGAVLPPAFGPPDPRPGQPIIWSVGPNRKDDGGRSLPYTPLSSSNLPSDDLVFPVPLAGERW